MPSHSERTMSPVPSVANVVAQVIIRADSGQATAAIVAKKTEVIIALQKLGFAEASAALSVRDAVNSGFIKNTGSDRQWLALK